ncbi:CDP-glycerol glycerophosphotransferase family protein [Candidatus Haliotispira prima]|uniref:CDP-glycerol glycerophosphotransferase family protein n=1 Tax=Candidatus Haliotispira prima TaxID=3034016 RepID=A0ABY8MNK1_9SPIO|nr:CDP-glycerol glycerophosphotransferase family protein [Candidatus Haliotispira prima]
MNITLAYIDPGTGSLLLSGIIGVGIALVYSLKNIFYRFWGRLTGKKIGISPDFSGKLVFYSEGAKYWKVFKPVLDELLRKEQEFVFLSSDTNDPGLTYIQNKGITAHYIGEMQQAIFFLNKLKADICVITTPQLGVLQLKRSKNVRHYSHITHSPIDIHSYKFYAFDEFDSVLCCNQSLIKDLQFLEDLRQNKKKKLFETGCTYYDEMLIRPQDTAEPNLILYAPTWGDISSLSMAKQVMEELLENDFNVLFRPHPQSLISDKVVLQELTDYFREDCKTEWKGRWELDEEKTFESAFSRCKAVICDLSGVIYDFVFLYQKPVFAFNTLAALQVGYEGYYLQQELSAIKLLQTTGGKLLEQEDTINIAPLVKKGLDEKIHQNKDFVYDNFIFNFQQSGQIAAEQILSLRQEILS